MTHYFILSANDSGIICLDVYMVKLLPIISAVFKRVLEAARKDGYFKVSPANSLASKAKPNKKVKDILEAQEYTKLMSTPCLNHAVKTAFVFSLYTSFRWIDVKSLTWEGIKRDEIVFGRSS